MGSFREKSRSFRNNKKTNFYEGHNFLCKKNLGVTASSGALHTNRSTYWNQNLRFGMVLFEKSQKVWKNGQQMENLTFRRVIILCVRKNLGVTANTGSSLQIVQSIEPKSQIRDRTFREKSRNWKHGQQMENLTFRRVITFCVKKILGVTANAGELSTKLPIDWT